MVDPGGIAAGRGASLEATDCPLCGDNRHSQVAVRADGLHIVRCQQCRLGFVNPRPTADAIAAMYRQGYYGGRPGKPIGYSYYRPSATAIRASPPYTWAFLADAGALEGARTLDVGCAFGHMVYWMQKSGARATGVDLSPGPVSWGRSKLGLDLRNCTLEELQEPDGSFDLITMVDLIEHLTDLRGFVSRLSSLLKPGGSVLIRTPNFGSFQIQGHRHTFLRFSLEHLLYFEADTLDKLMGRHGLRPAQPTRGLLMTPLDADEYLRYHQRGQGGVRRAIRWLPGIDLLRWVKYKLAPAQHVYRFGDLGSEASHLIGVYRKPPA